MVERKVLVISPHTDDAELGCGGSIVKFIERGYKVFYVAFSTAEESLPPHLPKNILEIEVKQATEILGIPSENLIIFKYKVRKLNYVRQDILEELVKLRKEIKPHLVLIPSINDLHQDHQTVCMEALRAFKNSASIIGYELPWNHINFSSVMFIPLEERHIEKKIEALKAYTSQFHREYMNPEFIRGLAKVRGLQINRKYAEAMEVYRWIMD